MIHKIPMKIWWKNFSQNPPKTLRKSLKPRRLVLNWTSFLFSAFLPDMWVAYFMASTTLLCLHGLKANILHEISCEIKNKTAHERKNFPAKIERLKIHFRKGKRQSQSSFWVHSKTPPSSLASFCSERIQANHNRMVVVKQYTCSFSPIWTQSKESRLITAVWSSEESALSTHLLSMDDNHRHSLLWGTPVNHV